MKRGNIAKLWLAVGLSSLCDGILAVGIPLAAVALTQSNFLIAMVVAVRFAAIALGGFLVGAFIERADSKTILIATNLCKCVVVIGFAIVLTSFWKSIALLLVLQIILGILEVTFDSTYLSIVTTIVQSKNLEQANTQLQFIATITVSFLGPALAVVIIGTGLPYLFFLCGGLFILSTGFLALLKVERPEKLSYSISFNSFVSDTKEGIHYIWQQKNIRLLVLAAAAINGAVGAFNAVYVIYVVKDIGLSQQFYGLLATALSVGSVIGIILSYWFLRFLKDFMRLTLSSFLIAGSTAIMLIFRTFPGLYASGIVAGIGILLWSTITVTLLQRFTPQALHLRVFATSKAARTALLPLGAFIGGGVASTLSASSLYVGLFVYELLIGLALLLWVIRFSAKNGASNFVDSIGA